jgi:hypothetical protein
MRAFAYTSLVVLFALAGLSFSLIEPDLAEYWLELSGAGALIAVVVIAMAAIRRRIVAALRAPVTGHVSPLQSSLETNFLSRQVAAYRDCRTFVPKTLRICAWIFWSVGAFVFLVPYYYAVFDTKVGAIAFVTFGFFAGIFAVIGFGFSWLSQYTNKEAHSPMQRVVTWCIGAVAGYGVLLLAIWASVEYLSRKG